MYICIYVGMLVNWRHHRHAHKLHLLCPWTKPKAQIAKPDVFREIPGFGNKWAQELRAHHSSARWLISKVLSAKAAGSKVDKLHM